jgi:hypothetical protein
MAQSPMYNGISAILFQDLSGIYSSEPKRIVPKAYWTQRRTN